MTVAANPKADDLLIPDLAEAERFLNLLDPEAEKFTFQTFAEAKGVKGNKRGAAIIRHGSLDDHADELTRAQAAGSYVGVMVQEGDGITHQGENSCRTKASVKRIRAVFQEDDGDGRDLPLEPHIVVQSSPGKFHRYFLVDGLSRDEFAAVMEVMIDQHGSDPNAKDLARVLRMPGFFNLKEDPFQVRVTHESGGQPYTREQILEAFKPTITQKAEPVLDEGPTTQVSIDPVLLKRAKSIALAAAIRTEEDHRIGRHDEVLQLGHRLRRDLFRRGVMPDAEAESELLTAALTMFKENMRQTNPAGEPVGMDWQNEWNAISDGFRNRNGEADRPGTRKGDFDGIQFGEDSDESNPEPEPEPEPGPDHGDDHFPEPYPGFMADVVHRALETAIVPQPHLTTLSTLIGMAACCGGKYHLPDGMRLNLNGINIAASGWGKEHCRKVATAVAEAGGADVKGQPASGQGLEDLLSDECSILMEIDEVAHLFEALNGKQKGSHLIALSSGLLKVFSASGDYYRTRILAVAKGIPKPRSIKNPCVSLLGFSTPEKLGDVLTTMNIEDGLMGRVLFAHGVGGIRPISQTQKFALGAMADRAREVAEANVYQMEINRETASASLNADVGTHSITIDPEAERDLDALKDAFWEAQEASKTVWGRTLMVRSNEKARRIAGVLAVWDRPIHPVITPEHVKWAAQLVRASNHSCSEFVLRHMHGGTVAANAERIMDYVTRIMKGEFRYSKRQWKQIVERESFVPLAMLLRQSKLDKPDFDRSIGHLIDAERLVAHEKNDRWVAPC
jgi:RepB DNA-primase from phage plasmid/Protein of unknown function (DUF3987)